MQRVLLTFLILLFLPQNADATTVEALSDRQIIERADFIAFGTVVSRQVVTEKSWATTRYVFQVYQPFVGAKLGQMVHIDLPGGKLNAQIQMTVPGTPQLKKGRSYLILAQKSGDRYLPIGLTLGVLTARRTGPNAYMLSRSIDGVHLQPAGDIGSGVTLDLAETSLAQWRQRIKDALKKPRAPLPDLARPGIKR